jgi:hypothetical protein
VALRRRLSVLTCAVLALAALPGVAHAAGCGPRGYAYAGLELREARFGIGASLTAIAPAVVESGHVAGWVGVGGPGQGPNGTDEWLQVGLNTSSDGADRNALYYEIARPSGSVGYVEVDSNVRVGKQLRVAVLETVGRPGVWRVWVDGRPVSPPISLPESHLALTPMAMSESWDGGSPACNRFAYRFRNLVVAAVAGGGWRPARGADVLEDPGYRVVRRRSAEFLCAAAPPRP